MKIVIGVNAYHPDSSACILIDGRIVAAVEEERLRRVKHWGGFPTESIRYCLRAAEIDITQVDAVAINSNPSSAFFNRFSLGFLRDIHPKRLFRRLKSVGSKARFQSDLIDAFGVTAGDLKIFRFDHHDCHLASGFCLSPFENSLLLSVDGFGDGQSMAWGIGDKNNIKVLGRITYPHSLGLFYQAITQYLGFWHYGDEYKVMGLAPYASSHDEHLFDDVVQLRPNGGFRLNLSYFRHHDDGFGVRVDDGTYAYGPLFSERFIEVFGPSREIGQPIGPREIELAWSAQHCYERALLNATSLFDKSSRIIGGNNLCIAGGCAMNSVANGRLRDSGIFDSVHVQSAPGDAGGAVGAALLAHRRLLGNFPNKVSTPNSSPYLGPAFTSDQVEACIQSHREQLEVANVEMQVFDQSEDLCRHVAELIASGKVIGWFQGRAEFGPRALGNRSILADPRRDDIRALLNSKIKLRESFRPFAPSILSHTVDDWFESSGDAPYMSMVSVVKESVRKQIPAVTHVDGTGRLQTVDSESNPLFYSLILSFSEITGVPILLNTSFNENEPMVTTPSEALDCFLRTKMDVLVMGQQVLTRC